MSAVRFKAGDIVRCVRTTTDGTLQEDRIYEVQRIVGGNKVVLTRDKEKDVGWDARLFELVARGRHRTIEPKFKVGDVLRLKPGQALGCSSPRLYTVCAVANMVGSYLYYFREVPGGWDEDRFELAKPDVDQEYPEVIWKVKYKDGSIDWLSTRGVQAVLTVDSTQPISITKFTKEQ